MPIACATITSAAELVPHYRAVRARLWAVPLAQALPKPPAEPEPAPEPAPKPLPLPAAAQAMPVPPPINPARIRIRDVQRAACLHYGTTLDVLIAKHRTAAIVTKRQVAIYIAANLCGRSLVEIGHYFGRRDHTTAMYARNKIAALVETDPGIRDDVAAIEARLGVGVDVPGFIPGVM